MTGKACIYQREIERHLRSARVHPNKGADGSKAFMLMPFGTTLDQVYRAQLEPCLASVVDLVNRADDIMRTGFVVCEKIYKQIQESQVICAEISPDNPNVFYELGMAYALDKPICMVIQRSVCQQRADVISKLNLGQNFRTYQPFEMLVAPELTLWQARSEAGDIAQRDDIVILLADRSSFEEVVNGQRMQYTIDQLCRGAIHRAIRSFKSDSDSLWHKSDTKTVIFKEPGYSLDDNDITFDTVERLIRQSRCVVVCTDEKEPCSYFWLGFAHGLEKDVIPVTVLSSPGQAHNAVEGTAERRKYSLPFDVRALWHIYFSKDEPLVLEGQLQSILRILSDKDKDTKHRRQFWDEVLQSGSVSIFVGSVELTENGRHVVGEWDYRTVSELSGFFSSLKETMETVIQTPVFQASFTLEGDDERERETLRLKKQLYERNSIIIASADVNDMTEVGLATYAGVEPFRVERYKDDPNFNGVVGFKRRSALGVKMEQREEPRSVYFRTREVPNGDESDYRGFDDYRGGIASGKIGTHFASQRIPYYETTETGYSVLYAHLAKFRLPAVTFNGEGATQKWAIVIQGISGPATLGLAQVLTGARYEQFTVFDENRNDSEVIRLLKKIVSEDSERAPSLVKFYRDPKNDNELPDMNSHSEEMTHRIESKLTESNSLSVECIVAIFVADGRDKTHDERKIIWWDFAMQPRVMVKPVPVT
jgi:hypothetical protein